MKRKHTSKRALRRMRRRAEHVERENAALRGLLRYRADEAIDGRWAHYIPSGGLVVPFGRPTIRETTISPHHFEADQ